MTVLPPNPPDRVEQAVSAHLQRTLDTQRGRAVAAFREKMQSGTLSFDRERQRSVWKLRMWAGAASALAACMALVLTLQAVHGPGNPAGPARLQPAGRLGALRQIDSPRMDQVELSRDLDGGVAQLPDETPVHVVREQTLRQTQWFDPADNATYSLTQPVEKVGYVRIQPN